jgi:hypothetical protein
VRCALRAGAAAERKRRRRALAKLVVDRLVAVLPGFGCAGHKKSIDVKFIRILYYSSEGKFSAPAFPGWRDCAEERERHTLSLRCSTNAARALRNHRVTIVAIPTCPLGFLYHLLCWGSHPCKKTVVLFEFSPCLSRACLCKKIAFTDKKYRFRIPATTMVWTWTK